MRGTLAVLLAGLVLGAPAPAWAAADQETIVQDDNLLLYRGAETTDRTLDDLAALGVDRVRVSVPWASISPTERDALQGDPTDPTAYEAAVFEKYDHLLDSADRVGVGVLFNVTGPAPRWAQGILDGKRVNGQYKPSSRGFGQLVEMLGRRFPQVGHWSIWNEPNQGAFLQPQWERGRGGRWIAASPRIYRELARAAIGGLQRSGHGEDVILLGETAPLGAKSKGRTRAMAPGRFLTELLCLDRRSYRPVLDPPASSGCDFRERGALEVSGYGHHPYPVKLAPRRRRSDPEVFALADRDRLARLLDAGLAARRFPAGLPLWMTELGWQTRPPDPFRGVWPAQQALWIAEAEQLLRADPRVVATSNFLLRDDVVLKRFAVDDKRRFAWYQTGLEYEDGRRKPAYEAFRLPLVAMGRGRVWGLVRPATGPTAVRLEFAAQGTDTWTGLGDTITTDPHGAFTADVRAPGPGRLRFAWTPPGPVAPLIANPLARRASVMAAAAGIRRSAPVSIGG